MVFIRHSCSRNWANRFVTARNDSGSHIASPFRAGGTVERGNRQLLHSGRRMADNGDMVSLPVESSGSLRPRDQRPGLVWWVMQVVFVLVLVGVAMAGFSIFGPDDSLGSRSPVGGNNISDNDTSGSMIGELFGRTHRIQIYAAWPEPLYSILDTDGRMVATELTAQEVALRFPELPLLQSQLRATKGSSGEQSDGFPLMGDVPMAADSDVPANLR